MQRPPRAAGDPKALDEGTDTYDTIEWLLKNVPRNNGRVGMLGISYDGWTTIMGALEPHPALKAISPQASPADMWLGDDFHHNGAFRLSYGFEYAAHDGGGQGDHARSPSTATTRTTGIWSSGRSPTPTRSTSTARSRPGTTSSPTPTTTSSGSGRRSSPTSATVKVPTLNVAGWWDQEDFYGPIRIYEELEKHDAKDLNFLVVGPWNHGGWGRRPGRQARPDRASTSPPPSYFRERGPGPLLRLSSSRTRGRSTSPRP